MAAAPRGRWLQHRAAKPLLFTLCLLPLAWLVYGAATDGLGANPAEALIRATGDWTLRLLCLALAVTPVRIALGVPALARMRRMLGLFTFFYAALHLLCYAWFDMGFDAAEIARDIAKRPFILVGMAAFALLLLLAATSFNRAIRWLGAALAAPAPRRVPGGGAGGAALLLDARGQERLRRGGGLCRRAGGAAAGARGPLAADVMLWVE